MISVLKINGQSISIGMLLKSVLRNTKKIFRYIPILSFSVHGPVLRIIGWIKSQLRIYNASACSSPYSSEAPSGCSSPSVSSPSGGIAVSSFYGDIQG